MSESHRDRSRLEQIAAELWPHENAKWKREMWIKEQMIPHLDPADLDKIHELLKDLASIEAGLGTDSTDDERKIMKRMKNKIMKRIKEISPEYYNSIKIQNT